MEPKKSAEANLENKKSVWMFVGLMSAFAIILASLAWTTFDVVNTSSNSMVNDDMEDEEIIAVNINQPPPPPPPPPPQQTTIIEIVEDDEEIEEELNVEDQEVEEDTVIEEVEEVEEAEEEEEEIFMIVEKMPAYPGCEKENGDGRTQCTNDKIRAYIAKSVKYPPIAIDAGIQGKVYVYYEIGKDGKVKNAKVVKGVHKSLDREALRVIKNLPKHEPGRQQGKNVTVKYTIPVNFTIKG